MTGPLTALWERMNPVEPSIGYLVKTMIVCLSIMALGGLIGHFWI
ncbi:hypothetical protein [Ponticoccus alexandrii]|nr:hypothetical protein [Ponticoccus alexandrii]